MKSYEAFTPVQFRELDPELQRKIMDDFNADWRDPVTHNLLPGHPGLPNRSNAAVGIKNKRKLLQNEYMEAISKAMTPDDLLQALSMAKEYAIKQRSARLLMEIVNFTADRMLGKPLQSMEFSQTTPEQWRLQMEERLQENPVLLPGEEIVEADFRSVGEDDNLLSTGGSSEGAGEADS